MTLAQCRPNRNGGHDDGGNGHRMLVKRHNEGAHHGDGHCCSHDYLLSPTTTYHQKMYRVLVHPFTLLLGVRLGIFKW
jgi:hypothetical protein